MKESKALELSVVASAVMEILDFGYGEVIAFSILLQRLCHALTLCRISNFPYSAARPHYDNCCNCDRMVWDEMSDGHLFLHARRTASASARQQPCARGRLHRYWPLFCFGQREGLLIGSSLADREARILHHIQQPRMEPFMIELTTADGHTFSAYRSDPTDPPKGAVIVLQEFYGVTEHIKAITDEFAMKGYVAIAPALFDRVKPNVTLGYDEGGIMEGLDLAGKIGMAEALADIEATAASLKSAGKIVIVGYCWGAYLAYAAANNVPGLACAVAYYGSGVADGLSEKRRIPTLLHFGENDPMIPAASVAQFRASHPEVSAFCYAAGHGFAFEGRDGYDPGAAYKAAERTMSWISQYVEGQPPIALKNAGAYAQQKVDKKKKKASDDMGPPLD